MFVEAKSSVHPLHKQNLGSEQETSSACRLLGGAVTCGAATGQPASTDVAGGASRNGAKRLAPLPPRVLELS